MCVYLALHSKTFAVCYESSDPPLEVLHTALSHAVMDDAHGVDDLLLDFLAAHDAKVRQEMVGHGNESVLGPALEPVHGATRDETRELQRTATELLSHLRIVRGMVISK